MSEYRTAVLLKFALVTSMIGILLGGYLIVHLVRTGSLPASTSRVSHLADSLTNARLDTLESRVFQLRVNEMRDALAGGQVDFASTKIQEIGSGFAVSELASEKHLTGIKVSGRVINTTSVAHAMAEFEIRIGLSSTNTFTIKELRVGGSQRFEVYVPDVPEEFSRSGWINYTQSTTLFYK